MSEDEVRQAIRRCGWTCTIREKASGRYLLAYKRINGQLVSVYICALTKLWMLQPQDVTWKLRDKETVILTWFHLSTWQLCDKEVSNQSA